MTDEQPPEPYTAYDVARMLKCSPKHVYEMVRRKRLRALPFGRPYRFAKPYIDRMLSYDGSETRKGTL